MDMDERLPLAAVQEPLRSTPRVGVEASGDDESLRRLAADADRASVESMALSALWNELSSGLSEVADTFASDERCYLLLREPTASAAGRSAKLVCKFEVLARMLLVGAQKVVAIDLDLAPSTVALLTKDALRAMGFHCLPSQTPPILAMAAYAAQTRRPHAARLSQLSRGGRNYRVVSVGRPDLGLADLLSPAECTVTRLLLEGRRRGEIARLRRTSERTVANQLAGAFQTLRASGRLDLIRRLVAEPAESFAKPGRQRAARAQTSLSP